MFLYLLSCTLEPEGQNICLLSYLPGVIPNFSFSPGDLPSVPAPLIHRGHWGEPPASPPYPTPSLTSILFD